MLTPMAVISSEMRGAFLHQQSSGTPRARSARPPAHKSTIDPITATQTGSAAEHQQHIRRISAHHDDVAMCKVDELDDAVDHAVPQGNQGINTPDVQSD